MFVLKCIHSGIQCRIQSSREFRCGLIREPEYEYMHQLTFNRVDLNVLCSFYFGSHKKELTKFRGEVPEERMLFHGPSEETSVKSICHQNFDPRIYREHRTWFGRGSYFARDAFYSNRFAVKTRQKHVFLAHVLVGRYTKGESLFRRPPPIPNQQHELYDSTVDDVENPKVHIIYDKEKCYPTYLIRYTDKEKFNPNQTVTSSGPPLGQAMQMVPNPQNTTLVGNPQNTTLVGNPQNTTLVGNPQNATSHHEVTTSFYQPDFPFGQNQSFSPLLDSSWQTPTFPLTMGAQVNPLAISQLQTTISQILLLSIHPSVLPSTPNTLVTGPMINPGGSPTNLPSGQVEAIPSFPPTTTNTALSSQNPTAPKSEDSSGTTDEPSHR